MRKTIIIYGICIAALIVVLRILEFKYVVRDIGAELYIGAIALIFTAFGIWAGTRFLKGKEKIVREVEVVTIKEGFEFNEDEYKKLGISQREFDVLEQMAKGMTNQEIADTLFISLNTVKTHSANLYVKLDVKRRTQAVQRAKELSLIP